MKAPSKLPLLRIIQGLVTGVLLVVIWHMVDGQKAGESLRGVQPLWLLAGLVALTTQTVLSAIRWRITAAQLGLHLTTLVAVQEYYLSQIINQVLPGGVLGDASRAVRSRGERGLLAASQAVIFERLAGQIALFVVLTGAFGITYLTPGGLDWPAWAISIVLSIIASGMCLIAVCLLMVFLRNPFQESVTSLLETMHRALAAPQVVAAQVFLSIATTFCNLVAFALCARAVGVVLSPAEVCALVPLILFTMLVPLTIMGWGLREGAASTLLPLAGATASAGFAASVAFGLTMLAATLPGLIVVWTRHAPIHKDAGT